MPVVLDTSFLIDLQRGKDAAVTELHRLVEERATLIIPSVAAVEYLAGSSDVDEDAAELAAAGEIQPFTVDDAREAGRIGQEALRRGRFPGWPDIMIAGFAKTRAATVLTANPGHFQDVPTRTYD